MISLLISWWIQRPKSTKRSSTGQMVRAEPSSMELKSYLSWSLCLFSWLMMAKDFVLFLISLSLTPSCLPGRSSLWALTLSPHTCGDCHHLLLTCRSSLWLFDGVAQSVMSVCRQVGREDPKRRTHGGGSNSKHTALLLVWNWTGKTLTKLGEQNN